MRHHRAEFSFVLIALACACLPALHGQTWQETVLHNFKYTDGGFPTANLIQAHDGNFYGTTATGGANGTYGTAYKITASGSFVLLHSFGGTLGSAPTSLVEGPDGNLYGTCQAGGTDSAGTFFRMTPSGAVTVLYNFNGGSDGSSPSAVILGTDGNFWGTTLPGSTSGNRANQGTIFKITTTGGLTTLHTFPLSGASGYNLGNSLVQASDGKFYGVALETPGDEIARSSARPRQRPTPSTSDGGILFSITPAGAYAQAYAFEAADGSDPTVPLVEGNNGKLYGETYYGKNFYGSIFTYTLSNSAFADLYQFTGSTDGGSPEGPLFLASDGNFYGTGSASEANGPDGGGGVVFRMTPGGVVSPIYTFDSGENGGVGSNPESGVTQGADGDLYGTTYANGGYAGVCDTGCGNVFKLVPSSSLAAPVQLSFNSSTTSLGSAVTLTWNVLNAFSDTMQLCYAYNSGTGAGTWTGKQVGALNGSTHLYSGSAQITPTAAGTYTYSLTCGGVEANSVSLTVNGKGKTTSTTALKDSPTAPVAGQTLTLIATVGGGTSPAPSGTVTFASLGFDLGVETLKSGSASLALSTAGLGAGTYPVTASYSGDTNYDSSVSSTLNVVISKSATTTTLAITPSTLTQPGTVKFTGTVKRSTAGTSGAPTGTVAFSTGTYTIATVNLSAGAGSYSLTLDGLPAGSYPIAAKYSGDGGDDASSAAGSLTVK